MSDNIWEHEMIKWYGWIRGNFSSTQSSLGEELNYAMWCGVGVYSKLDQSPG